MRGALGAIELPALAHPRERALGLLAEQPLDAGALVAWIESDPALTLATMTGAATVAPVASVPEAVDALSPNDVRDVIADLPLFDFFESDRPQGEFLEAFRLHALAVQSIADRIHLASGAGDRERLRVSALLHDIGEVILIRRWDGYEEFLREPVGASERLTVELNRFGMDHALAGGTFLHRAGLPRALSAAVWQHHAAHAQGDAAVIRVADLLADYMFGLAIKPSELTDAGAAVGLATEALRDQLADLPLTGSRHVRRQPPLSTRQLQVVRALASGRRYKEIAHDLGVSANTVRTHLHTIYKRLGVPDRAQAVLLATRNGWLD
jgi:DNA-binding CsgD family transcriptional regulator/HD-like signal output (HDOD) protein